MYTASGLKHIDESPPNQEVNDNSDDDDDDDNDDNDDAVIPTQPADRTLSKTAVSLLLATFSIDQILMVMLPRPLSPVATSPSPSKHDDDSNDGDDDCNDDDDDA